MAVITGLIRTYMGMGNVNIQSTVMLVLYPLKEEDKYEGAEEEGLEKPSGAGFGNKMDNIPSGRTYMQNPSTSEFPTRVFIRF